MSYRTARNIQLHSNVMAHAQKPYLVFQRNGRVHLNRQGCQFSLLLAPDVCASAVVMLDTPSSEVVWRVLATHSIRQFPLHFPSRAHHVPSHFNWALMHTFHQRSSLHFASLHFTTLHSPFFTSILGRVVSTLLKPFLPYNYFPISPRYLYESVLCIWSCVTPCSLAVTVEMEWNSHTPQGYFLCLLN